MGRDEKTLVHPEDSALLHDQESCSDDLPPGTVIGDYILGDLIAKGGGGSVYHAEHKARPRRVALKILHANLASQPKMVERFVREVKMANLLRHPNIVEIDEVGVLPSGRPFFAMEYLPGKTLDELLRAESRLSPEEALYILEPVCSALEAAHAAGIIHRDVKASNILVTRSEPPVVKLLDFGIAKLTTPDAAFPSLTSVGRQVGTPSIMAPEQLTGGPVDARIDVYALGILLYRLLTGSLPFDARTLGELSRQHLEDPAPRPSERLPIAAGLDAIVLRCLEKDPARRWGSVKAFRDALREALDRPPREPQSRPFAQARGVAIYLELRIHTDDDELDEALSHDLACVLDLTEERLRSEGFLLPSVTGSEILGVRLLPDDPDETRRARQEALLLAMSLREELDRRPTADARVCPNLSLHVDEILVRPGEAPEIMGGALVSVSAWAPREDASFVRATSEVTQGLSGFEMTSGPGPLVAVARRSMG